MPVRIVVADTGSGIPADEVPLIFDRFSTGDAGRPRGTGLIADTEEESIRR